MTATPITNPFRPGSCRREDAASVRRAYKGLSLTAREYRALFGAGRITADRVLDSLERGVRPAVLIAGAKAALAATEREGLAS